MSKKVLPTYCGAARVSLSSNSTSKFCEPSNLEALATEADFPALGAQVGRHFLAT